MGFYWNFSLKYWKTLNPSVNWCRSSNGSLNLETLCFIHTFRHVLHVYDILFYDYKKDFMICIRVVFFQMGLFRPISIGCLQDANNSLEFISKPYRMGTAHCLFFLRERLFWSIYWQIGGCILFFFILKFIDQMLSFCFFAGKRKLELNVSAWVVTWLVSDQWIHLLRPNQNSLMYVRLYLW